MPDGPRITDTLTDAQRETLTRAYSYDIKTGRLARSNIARALRLRKRRIRSIKHAPLKKSYWERMTKHWQMEAFYMLLLDEEDLPPTCERYIQLTLAAGRLAEAEIARHRARVAEGRVPSPR